MTGKRKAVLYWLTEYTYAPIHTQNKEIKESGKTLGAVERERKRGRGRSISN